MESAVDKATAHFSFDSLQKAKNIVAVLNDGVASVKFASGDREKLVRVGLRYVAIS